MNASPDVLLMNDLFKIEFDLPTPRPHFILLENKVKQVKKSIIDVQENEIRSFLTLIQTFIREYSLASENLVLSFHIGYWVVEIELLSLFKYSSSNHFYFIFKPFHTQSNNPYFHCHICTSEQTYLRIFNQHKLSIPWHKFKPTRNWKIRNNEMQQKNMADLYEENVLNYKSHASRTAMKYQQEEIAAIMEIKRKCSITPHLEDDEWFSFEFDVFEPKVRI